MKNIFKHSLLMVKRTFRNYLLLSVTVLLSFSIMLGYLVFVDSNMFNSFNEILGADSNVIISYNDASYETRFNIMKLISQMDKTPDTHYYIQTNAVAKTSFGQDCNVNYMPSYVWGIFKLDRLNEMSGIRRLKIDGKWEISLGSDEAIVSDTMYRSIEKNHKSGMEVKLVIKDKSGKNFLKTYKIVGSYRSDVVEFKDLKKSVNSDEVFVSQASIAEIDVEFNNMFLAIHTKRPLYITKQMGKYQIGYSDIVGLQNYAKREMKTAIKNKYNIAIVLFFLLGINLYSSFKNSLNDRKFEIGVKRALGANKVHIMLQFIIESFMVMLVNIFLSIYFILNLSMLYKFIQFKIYHRKYTIIMSSESVILFFIFSTFITLIFCTIFAYQSTQVEVIQYIKEE